MEQALGHFTHTVEKARSETFPTGASYLVSAGGPHSRPKGDQTLQKDPQKDQVQPHYMMPFCILPHEKDPTLASALSTP